jgi:hypothetical protein
MRENLKSDKMYMKSDNYKKIKREMPMFLVTLRRKGADIK